jgi:phosphoribosylformylglycinamidine cyclo-ligase
MVLTDKYNKRGVSAEKKEVHAAIEGMDKGLYSNAFCKILPDYLDNNEEDCIIMHSDTAGSKSSLAYIYWKETGDYTVWKGIVEDAMVMNLDDMACVGCLDNFIVSSTIGRNKNLIDGEVLKNLIQHPKTYKEKLAKFGINLHLAGGETADVGDIVRTTDVGYTIMSKMKRKDLIINDMKADSVIVGFASYGQSIYEDNYNSGIGSNGLTSARHDVLNHIYYDKYPESFDPNVDASLIYCGSKNLKDIIEIDGKTYTIGQLLLSPTRTFLPLLKEIIPLYKKNIQGIIHNTGGGLTKILHFVENKKVVKNNPLPIPPVFELIQKESNMDWKEMYKVFNMGQRLEIYTDKNTAEALIKIAANYRIDAQIIGHVEDASQKQVIVESEKGTFIYNS